MLPSYCTDISEFKKHGRKPDFNNLLAVLRGQVPSRPTLFEFSIGEHVARSLADPEAWTVNDKLRALRLQSSAFANGGYDYVPFSGSAFTIEKGKRTKDQTVSLNDGALITDWASFEQYTWNNPDDYDYSVLAEADKVLPDGMKILVRGPGGVLENVISLTGFDNLCYMLVDEPELVQKIFDHVGSSLLRYYENSCQFDSVGGVISNDDWGFKTQAMISPADIRKYVVPWHKKIVELAHASGRPAMLHSCGNLTGLWDAIIDEIGFDGKHSYEDSIEPVEDAYERLNGRIAVLGGIDVDFLCRQTSEEIHKRSTLMLERVSQRGGYALGSGNSIPHYVPVEGYLAMVSAATWA